MGLYQLVRECVNFSLAERQYRVKPDISCVTVLAPSVASPVTLGNLFSFLQFNWLPLTSWLTISKLVTHHLGFVCLNYKIKSLH